MSRNHPSSHEHQDAAPDLASTLAVWLRQEAHEGELRSDVSVATAPGEDAAEAALRRVFQRLPRQLTEQDPPAGFAQAVMARVALEPDPGRLWLRRLERWGAVTLLAAAGLFLLLLPALLVGWWSEAGLGVHSVAQAAHWLVSSAADWARAALAFWAWCAGLLATLLRALATTPGLLMLTTCALLGLGTWSVVQGHLEARVSSPDFLTGSS